MRGLVWDSHGASQGKGGAGESRVRFLTSGLLSCDTTVRAVPPARSGTMRDSADALATATAAGHTLPRGPARGLGVGARGGLASLARRVHPTVHSARPPSNADPPL